MIISLIFLSSLISGVDDRVFLTETAPPGMSPISDWDYGNSFLLQLQGRLHFSPMYSSAVPIIYGEQSIG